MYYIKSIQVKNFKSIKEHEFQLSPYTPIVGYNNAGKTNLMKSLVWLLKPKSLSEKDFFDVNLPVEIEAEIEGISTEILDKLGDTHSQKIQPFILNESISIKRIQGTVKDTTSQIKLEIKDADGNWQVNPAGIPNAISAMFPEPIFIGAMENAIEDAGANKTSTTIGKLLAEITKPLREKYDPELKAALKDIKSKITATGNDRDETLEKFDKSVNKKLKEIFPKVGVKLHLPAPSINDIFKKATLLIEEEGRDGASELSTVGTGALRSIQIALIRELAESKTQEDTTTQTLLLIDEPELYLHPQAIEQLRASLRVLSEKGYQVLFSTHSPQMITSKDAPDVILLRKNTEISTHSRTRLKESVASLANDANSQFGILFSLTHSKDILFSDSVLLAEGKTENRLLPLLFEKMTNCTFGMKKIALVAQGGSSNTHKSMQILKAMDLPTKAVVDLDYAFTDAVRAGIIAKDDPDITKCKSVFKSLSDALVTLDDNGLPKKNKEKEHTAAQGYKVLATQPEAQEAINQLFEKLKLKEIWIWRQGTIENVLNIKGKNEQVWSCFWQTKSQLEFDDLNREYPDIKKLFDWVAGHDT